MDKIALFKKLVESIARDMGIRYKITVSDSSLATYHVLHDWLLDKFKDGENGDEESIMLGSVTWKILREKKASYTLINENTGRGFSIHFAAQVKVIPVIDSNVALTQYGTFYDIDNAISTLLDIQGIERSNIKDSLYPELVSFASSYNPKSEKEKVDNG